MERGRVAGDTALVVAGQDRRIEQRLGGILRASDSLATNCLTRETRRARRSTWMRFSHVTTAAAPQGMVSGLMQKSLNFLKQQVRRQLRFSTA